MYLTPWWLDGSFIVFNPLMTGWVIIVFNPFNLAPCRLVVDGWLELKLESSEAGQQVLAALQTLRTTWTHLLEMKLEASKSL